MSEQDEQLLNEQFTYHAPQGDQTERYQEVRAAGLHLAKAIARNVSPSADRTAAFRKVREAVATANAGIALEKVAMFIVVALLSVMAVGCTSVSPDAGNEAVLIQKPILFGSGGVDPKPVQPGRTYVAITTQAVLVDIRPIQFSVKFDDLMTKDGVPLDFDASVRVRVTDSVRLVSKFGADGWFQRNLEQPFRTIVRDAVKKRGMNETAIDATAAEAIDAEVTTATKAAIKTQELPVDLLDVTVGRANPPDAIKTQRTETATQEQRANTEKQRTLAEVQRLEAEKARAAADNAYREAMRLSPEQFLQLEQIKMLHEVCAGGKCTFISGGGAVPTLSVK